MAVSDFGTFVGADQTLTTTSTPPPPSPPPPPPATPKVGEAKASGGTATVRGPNVSVRVSCKGAAGSTCRLALRLTVTETLKGKKILAVSAGKKARKVRKVVSVGSKNVTLTAGQALTVRVPLNSTGRKLLAQHHRLKVTLRVIQTLSKGGAETISRQVVTFKVKPAKKSHTHRAG